ncbi:aureocin A53 family class IId bacteriocin [Bacillus thuringiensis]|nr:aureocin A53 family class IId bacteriocin [Bacillus thuringiensis]
MAIYMNILAKLSVKAAAWAVANKGRVLAWIRDGLGIDWIIRKIYESAQ